MAKKNWSYVCNLLRSEKKKKGKTKKGKLSFKNKSFRQKIITVQS